MTDKRLEELKGQKEEFVKKYNSLHQETQKISQQMNEVATQIVEVDGRIKERQMMEKKE